MKTINIKRDIDFSNDAELRFFLKVDLIIKEGVL